MTTSPLTRRPLLPKSETPMIARHFTDDQIDALIAALRTQQHSR